MNRKEQSSSHRKSLWNGHSGLTLVEMMVGVAILGILFVVVSAAYNQEAQIRRKFDDQMNHVEVVRRILFSIDCAATRIAASASTCSTSPYISLRSVTSANPVIVKLFNPDNAIDATKIGNVFVRAKCGPDHRIVIEIQDARIPSATWVNITQKVPIGCYMP